MTLIKYSDKQLKTDFVKSYKSCWQRYKFNLFYFIQNLIH